jgi:uncharacterized protein (DUF1697 family)
MASYIALLRAVNVAGHRPVAMEDLRALLAQLGLADARALLQSGNLVFSATARPAVQLERLLEAETKKRLGLETDFFVRTAKEWRALVDANPFRAEARRDPAHMLVLFLRDATSATKVAALRAAITGRERVQAPGRELYAVYPDGVGRSRLTSALVEKALGTRATGRNWNTVLKLAALVSD